MRRDVNAEAGRQLGQEPISHLLRRDGVERRIEHFARLHLAGINDRQHAVVGLQHQSAVGRLDHHAAGHGLAAAVLTPDNFLDRCTRLRGLLAVGNERQNVGLFGARANGQRAASKRDEHQSTRNWRVQTCVHLNIHRTVSLGAIIILASASNAYRSYGNCVLTGKVYWLYRA